MQLTSEWFRCSRCYSPITEHETISKDPRDIFPQVVQTEVVVTPPLDGPQVDTGHPHECSSRFLP
jgi:hypothetical protein